jgi:hypothetical protein
MTEFNPQEHLIDIRGRAYLEVKWRLVWLRQEHPDWAIATELVDRGDPVVMRATIADATGRVLATGHAEYPRGRPYPAVMKCETAAIGRALAHCGFGTQFGGEDVEEADLVDAPAMRHPPGTGARASRTTATWPRGQAPPGNGAGRPGVPGGPVRTTG